MYTKNGKKTRANCCFERKMFPVSPHLVLVVRSACHVRLFMAFRGKTGHASDLRCDLEVGRKRSPAKRKNRPDRDGPNG
jgi:hypothetical protein